MKAGRWSRTLIPLCLLACTLLTACGTTAPTRFYLLDALAKPGQAATGAGQEPLSIALSTVEIPEHLNRPQIVTRRDGHQVGVDEFNRWAEPLEAGFTAALAENLALLLGSDRIYITNRMRTAGADYQVAVKVLRFDGWPGGEAVLVCLWEFSPGDSPESARRRRFDAKRQVDGPGYPDLVAALSSMLGDLGREIAGQIASAR